MRKQFIALIGTLILTSLWIMGCVAETPVPPNPADVAFTMVMQRVDAEATEMVINLNFTATGQVVMQTVDAQHTQAAAAVTEQARNDANATAVQERKDANATAEQERMDAATAQARRDAEAATAQARRDAESTAQQGRVDMVNTQSAYATSTFVAMTLTAVPTSDYLTAQNAAIGLTRAALDVKQKEETNRVEWAVPMLLAVLLAGAGVLWVVRRSDVQEVKNEDGDVEGVKIGRKWVRPRLLTGPVLDLNTGKIIESASAQEQSRVTERSQAIDAISKMPVNPPASAAQSYNNMFGGIFTQKKLPAIEVIPPDQVKDILEEVEGQVVEEG